jgi:hypothetical protein
MPSLFVLFARTWAERTSEKADKAKFAEHDF